jgi:hypothetical protein
MQTSGTVRVVVGYGIGKFQLTGSDCMQAQARPLSRPFPNFQARKDILLEGRTGPWRTQAKRNLRKLHR